MSTPDFTAGNVMDSVAALLNDVAKTLYTYSAQLPYLNMASRELQELFEQNEVPVTAATSAEIGVNAGERVIAFNAVAPLPVLPFDLIEPQQLWERNAGAGMQYTPMRKVDSLPEYLEGIEVGMFIYWAWNGQEIRLLPSTSNNVVKIDYIKQLFATIVDENSVIGVINGRSFMEFRTAALCAEYIGENPTRAASLNGSASLAMDRVLGIGAKGRQSIITRRRPFRAAYKTRGVAR